MRKSIKHKYSSLLIIECDSNKLQRQNIDIASKINDLFQKLPFCKHKYIRTFEKSDLCLKINEISKEHYDIIVLTGHTFTDGGGRPVRFDFASDYKPELSVLPSFLNTFKPKCLIMASCKGSHFITTDVMFNGMPTLKEIYGSPVLTNSKQLQILLLLIPYIIFSDKYDDGILFLSNIVNFVQSGGYIVRHTRAEFINKRPIKYIQQEMYDSLKSILSNSH
ncbi:hypothetical protein HZA73_09625 [candidate division TA06 bacterium]|nr:hypothetical protein [candidate division TA06 bacterium]